MRMALGITIALRDAFSSRARLVERRFRSMENTASGSLRRIRRAFAEVEAGLLSVTRTVALGAAILATVAYPTRKAAEFGRAVSQVATIADQATLNLDRMKKELIEQSFRFPSTPVQQAEALYTTITSGFLETAEALEVLENATVLAVAGITDTQTAVDGLTSMLLAYQLQADAAEEVSNKMFQTLRYGKVYMEELAHTIGMVAGFAASAGISMEELLGTYATMTLGGLSPEQAAQYSRQIIMGIVKPTRQAEKAARDFGVEWSLAAMQRAGGFQPFMEQIYNALGGDETKLAQLITGRQAMSGAAILFQQMDKWKEVIEGISDPFVTDEFGIRISSMANAERLRWRELDYQWTRLTSGWVAVATVMGEASKKVLSPIVSALATMTGWVLKLIQNFPLLTRVLMGLVATVGISAITFGILTLKMLLARRGTRLLILRMRRLSVTLLGVRYQMVGLVKTLSAAFFWMSVGSYIAYKAWKDNWGGIQTHVRNFVLLVRGLTHALTNMKGTWGEVPYELAKQIDEAGLWTTFKFLYGWLARIKFFAIGMGEGIKAFFYGLGQAAKTTLDFVARMVEPFSGSLAQKIRDFMESWIANPGAIQNWQRIGVLVGKVLGFLLTTVVVTKTLRGLTLLVRGAWALTAMTMRAALLPLKAMDLLLLGMPGKIFKAAKAWARLQLFGGIRPGYEYNKKVGRYATRKYGGYTFVKASEAQKTGLLQKASGWMKSAGTAILGLGAGKLALIAAAIIAVGVAIYQVVKHWRVLWFEFKRFVAWIFGPVGKMFSWLRERLQGVNDSFLLLTGPAAPMLLMVKHWDKIKEAASGAWEAIKEGFEKYAKPAIDELKAMITWVGQKLGLIKDPSKMIDIPWHEFRYNPQMTLEQLKEVQQKRLEWYDLNLPNFHAGLIEAFHWNAFLKTNERLAELIEEREKKNPTQSTTKTLTKDDVEDAQYDAYTRAMSDTGLMNLLRSKWPDAEAADPYQKFEDARMRELAEMTERRYPTSARVEAERREVEEIAQAVSALTQSVQGLLSRPTKVSVTLDGREIAAGTFRHTEQIREDHALRQYT